MYAEYGTIKCNAFKYYFKKLQSNHLEDQAPPTPNYPNPHPQSSTQIVEDPSTEILLKSPSPNNLQKASVDAENLHSSMCTENFASFRGFFT